MVVQIEITDGETFEHESYGTVVIHRIEQSFRSFEATVTSDAGVESFVAEEEGCSERVYFRDLRRVEHSQSVDEFVDAISRPGET